MCSKDDTWIPTDVLPLIKEISAPSYATTLKALCDKGALLLSMMTATNGVLLDSMTDGKRRWITEKMKVVMRDLPPTLQSKVKESLLNKKRPMKAKDDESSCALTASAPSSSAATTATSKAPAANVDSEALVVPAARPPAKKLKLMLKKS